MSHNNGDILPSGAKEINVSRRSFFKLGTLFTEVKINVSQRLLMK